jgi:tetratricopeptide (TPR) repeat protein
VRQAETTDDQLAEAFGEMGRLYHAHYLSEPAFACYLSAKMLAPQDFRWVYLLGVLYQQTSQLEQAAGTLKRALEIRPNDAPAKLRLAQVYLELNETDSANPLFRESLAEDGMIATAASGLGRAALSQRRFHEAVEWFEKALEEQPQATRLNYSLGIAYWSLGEVAKAKQ